MKVIVEDLAKQCLADIYNYNSQYSLKKAREIDRNIRLYIHILEDSPYIGRYISKVSDKHFRELIFRNTRNSTYRITYFISELTNTIYILYIVNSKQNFNHTVKLYNYFKNFNSNLFNSFK